MLHGVIIKSSNVSGNETDCPRRWHFLASAVAAVMAAMGHLLCTDDKRWKTGRGGNQNRYTYIGFYICKSRLSMKLKLDMQQT